MVNIYYIDDSINQFEIVYMINPSLHVKKVFIKQVEKCLNATFHETTMENIRDFLKNKNTCVITLIMFYGDNGVKPKQMYRVLSCVLYSIIDNYFCIDYLLCQSKSLSIISSNKILEKTSLNILLGIGIP